MSREDQFSVTASIDNMDGNGNRLAGASYPLGVFDKKTGGEVDSEESKFKPGGMGDQVSLGGSKSVSNLTIGRMYDLVRDTPHRGKLLNAVGKFDFTVSVQHLDLDKNPVGAPEIYKGKVKQFSLPDHDSESTDAAMFEVEMSSATLTIL